MLTSNARTPNASLARCTLSGSTFLIREHGGGGTLDRHLANGTQGRLISWHPEKPTKDKKALLASHPDLTARFVKEGSVSKSELVADVDFIDVAVRQENLTTIPGMPVMAQMPLQPCYGLTIHKTQALSTVGWRRDALCLHSVRRAKQARRDIWEALLQAGGSQILASTKTFSPPRQF